MQVKSLGDDFVTADRLRDEFHQRGTDTRQPGTITPTNAADRTKNPLRPQTLDEIEGQDRAKRLMRRAIEACFERTQPLDHTLLVGRSGTGKSTFSHAIANDLGVAVYELEAPVSMDTLLELRTTMYDGDILKVEEIHQQGIMERRGRSAATQPEVLYAVMEDRVLPTEHGVLEYPSITLIGTTTDEGMLPEAFLNRFPLRPRLDPYTDEQLRSIVRGNGRTLGISMSGDAVELLAGASAGIPRHANNLVRNAALFGRSIDLDTARAVLEVNGIAEDGLSPDQQAMLVFLRQRAQRVTADGQVRFQASVNTIATAIGKGRDSKAVALRIEPLLIERGLVQVGHGGRTLTDAGVVRAEELWQGGQP